MHPIKILLADDHTIVRKGIRSLLDGEADIEVVDEAENGREVLEKVEKLLPDIVLMDSTMPVLNGLEATRQLTKRFPQVKVLVLTMHTNEEYILQFLQAGASGYLVKQSAPQELVSAIQSVHRGDIFLSPAISRTIVEEYIRQAKISDKEDRYDQLTDREREVLQLIVEGFSNREIAERLNISLKTAGVHRINLMHKLNIHNLTELTKFAIRKGIISLES
ncbi:MAG: DNA-binding response regulator [Anaerolineae bacterium]|nr:response regulator transcription factor [Anaerolineales bacterium]MCQ3974191.1 DNA-binding response regulator [Anaerolineae bacterium]